MTTTTAAIKGKMGEYEYFQTTMKPSDVIAKTASAIDYFSPTDWEEMGEIARVQREPDFVRILNEIAPYLIRSKKRFFNSIVVLLDEKNCTFQALDSFPVTSGGKQTTASKLLLPAYQSKAESIGFLDINQSEPMLILDGQHRMLSLKKVLNSQNEMRETFKKLDENFDDYKNHGLANDDISVIFVKVPDLLEMRKIFEDLNTYAKRQSKDIEIFGSESNPWFKICQWFCNKDKENPKLGAKEFLTQLVQKKGTSLSDKSLRLTTAAHMVNMIKFLTVKMKFKKQMQLDSIKEDLRVAKEVCIKEMNEFFLKISPYGEVINENNPEKRKSLLQKYKNDKHKDALLFKPMPQVALFKAIQFLKKQSDMDVDAIYRGANKIDFAYNSELQHNWKNLVIASGGTILTSAKVEALLSDILIYFIAGKSKCEKLKNGKEWLDELLNRYKEQLEDDNIKNLPTPIFK